MPGKREKPIEEKIKNLLKAVGAKYVKVHGSIYSEKGTSDLLGCYKGRSFVIEVKSPTGDSTELQQKRLNEWAAAGAIVFVARSVRDVIEQLIVPVRNEMKCQQDG